MDSFRGEFLSMYQWPKFMYYEGVPREDAPKNVSFEAKRKQWSAAFHLRELGLCCYMADKQNCMSRKKRTLMDVDSLVGKWKEMLVGMCLAHTKDEADRYEAQIEQCLNPILAAPIKQVRELARKLDEALKSDSRVPLLVHSAFSAWIDMMKDAPDDDFKELKSELAREIVELVEPEAKRDLPGAMARALMWRSPSQLEQMKTAVVDAKQTGKEIALRGRESCLFLEVGPESAPEVCVQV